MLKKITTYILIFTFSFVTAQNSTKRAKYIFYFIGDGMSLPQISLTEAYLAKISNEEGFKKSNISKLKLHTWCYNYSKNRLVTCSAAAATALATGNRTTINTIGKSENHTENFESIAYKAKKTNKKIGIISSVSLNHATPAGFYANVDNRSMYYEIGKQLFKSGFDLFAGGGLNKNTGDKKDLPDLYLTKSELKIIKNNNTFLQSTFKDLPLFFVHENLENEAEMPFAIDKDKNDLSLSQITKKTIELLDNSDGFFIMIEGGKIDWACHSNDAISMIYELIDFDNSVKEALLFYEKHPDETLIVVVGDHETGGLTLGNDENGYETSFELLKNQVKSFYSIEQELIPLAKLKSEYINVYNIFQKNFGFGKNIVLTSSEKELLETKWEKIVKSKKESDIEKLISTYVQYSGKILNTKAGVAWTSTKHTALPVTLYVHGVGEEKFERIIDITDIPKIILSEIN